MTQPVATLQRKLEQKLLRAVPLGETYQAPNGGELVIQIVDAFTFNCVCCPAPLQTTTAGAGSRPTGPSFCSVLHHMGTKEHFTNFRQRCFHLPFDELAWLNYSIGNQHGPQRAKRNLSPGLRARHERAERRCHLRRRWRLFVRIAGLVAKWHARAVERAYAPGGCGYDAARADFEERAGKAQRQV